jgi:hypothetical protein
MRSAEPASIQVSAILAILLRAGLESYRQQIRGSTIPAPPGLLPVDGSRLPPLPVTKFTFGMTIPY